MKMTIGKKILFGFIAVLLILTALASFSFYQLIKVDNQYTDLIDDKAKKLIMIKNLEVAAKQEESGLRGFLLIGDEEAHDFFNKTKMDYRNASDQLAQILKLPEAQRLLRELDSIENEYVTTAEEAIRLYKDNKKEEAALLEATKGRDTVIKLSQKAEELSSYQQKVMDVGNTTTSENVESIKMLIIIVSMIAIIVSVMTGIYTGRIISKPVRMMTAKAKKMAAGDLTSEAIYIKNNDEIGELALSFNEMTSNLRELIQQVGISAENVASTSEELSASAEQTSKASEQITDTMQEVATGVDKQFKSVEKTTQTIQKMAAGIHQIASHSQTVTTTALDTSQKASEGGKVIQQAIQQMNSIHQTVQGLSGVVDGLGDRSKEISKILDVITDISAQTNLLAINAAIEAARAGEHGRGFAVVADEVQRLAEQSVNSTQQISLIISSIREETTRAVHSMETASSEVMSGIHVINSAGESFSQIEGSVNQVTEQIYEVSTGTKEMTVGSDQIVQSMKFIAEHGEIAAAGTQEVSAATEEQLASMEEITSSAISLSKMAEDLQVLIRKFKV
jgi:methyl-accepting chemotaxis protein